MSDAIRQIRARARRKAAGLVRLEFWVPASRRDAVRAAVAAVLEENQTQPVTSSPETLHAPPPSAEAAEAVPVVQRRRRLITDLDELLD